MKIREKSRIFFLQQVQSFSIFGIQLACNCMKSLAFILALTSFSLSGFSQVYGDPIVFWDFAEGIPEDWVNESDTGISLWEYRGPNTEPDNTVCGRGSCGAGSEPPASISLDNGFVLFDSNYWDDDQGPCGPGLGSGQDPAPHLATLSTGSIDLSQESAVVLTWQQQFKHFQTSTSVQVSVNQGDWTTVHTNAGPFSPNVQWVSVNISSLAANQSDVRIRFRFSGTYYWWCIDDVYLYIPNNNDILLTEMKYTDFVLFGGGETGLENMEYDAIPSAIREPFDISAKFVNVGALTQTGVTLFVDITNEQQQTVYAVSTGNVSINPGQQLTLSLSPYTPPSQTGKYTINYNVEQNEADEAPDDNIGQKDFRITNYLYARDEGVSEGPYETPDLQVGNPYELGNIFEMNFNGFELHSIGVALDEGTVPGSMVYGIVYDLNRDSILARTPDYEVNSAFLNAPGENKIMYLDLEEPLAVSDTSWLNVQCGTYGDDSQVKICYSGTSPDQTSFLIYPQNNFLYFVRKTPMVMMHIFPAGTVSGCTDPLADNYSPNAEDEDGSCLYYGCANPLADNYDPGANYNDGSCILTGCTDAQADNYNPEATDDDGSCIFSGCTNPNAVNYDPQANLDDGSCIIEGCTDPEAANYDPQANADNGSCLYPGCTDPEADNYDPQANENDGSCLYSGCTNPSAINYDPQANQDDGSCIIPGCTNPIADNYNPEANQDDGSCIISGCTDPEADNYYPEANTDDGSCIYFGCTDENATNYDPGANTNDGSCTYDNAFLWPSASQGCLPLFVILDNQTNVVEGAQCQILIDGLEVYSDCQESYEWTFTEVGSYTVTYIYSMGEFSSEFNTSIDVFAIPDEPVLSFNPDSYVLSCEGCSGLNSVWILDGVIIAENQISLNATTSGTYTVIVSTENNCSSQSEPIEITLAEAEMHASPTESCAPLEVVVFNQTLLAGEAVCSYSLNGETVHEGCEGTFDLVISDPGEYELVYTYQVGNYIASDAETLTVFGYPEIPLIEFDMENTITCLNCEADVIWYFNDVEIAGASGSSLEVSENGIYQVVSTNEDGCESISEALEVIVTTVRVHPKPELAVYPNPANDWLIIETNSSGLLRWEMLDITGRLIDGGENLPADRRLDVSALPSGRYFLRVTSDNGLQAIKPLQILR